MSKKVKLTITVLDAPDTLAFNIIGFLAHYGYFPITKKTCAKRGKLNFVYEKKEEVGDGDV